MKLRQVALAAIMVAASTASSAGVLLSEGFDNVAGLTGAGWVLQNLSSPVGTTGWFQGNTGVFTAQSGPDDSYIAANFENAGLGGSVSNWLMTPELSLATATTLDVQLRAAGLLLDTLEIYYSASGASTSVADFTLLGSYDTTVDEGWVSLSLGLAAQGGTGRFAVRYFVGNTDTDGNYVGVDSLTVSDSVGSVPVPGTLALAGLAFAALGATTRRRA